MDRMPSPAIRFLRGRPALAVVDQGVVSATGVATTLIIGRGAGPVELGVFALGLAALLIADQSSAALTSTPYMIMAPGRAPALRRRLAGGLFVQQAVLSGVCAVLLASALPFLNGPASEDPQGRAIRAIVFALPAYTLSQSVRRYLFVEMRFKAALAMDAGTATLQIGALMALWVMGVLSGSTALLIVGGAKLVGASPILLVSRIRWLSSWRYLARQALRAWRLGRWVLAASVLWSLTAQAYPWFLTEFHDAAAAGVWAACVSIGNLLNPVLLGGQNLAGPRLIEVFATEPDSRAMRFTYYLSGLFFVVLAPMAVLLSLSGGKLLGLLYGAAYSGYGPVVAVFGWSVVLAGVSFPISRALFAKERTDLDLAGSCASAAVVWSVGLALIRILGPLGAALSAFAANGTGGVSRYAFLTTGRKRLQAEPSPGAICSTRRALRLDR